MRYDVFGRGRAVLLRHRAIRSVKVWCISVRHGHGTAVLIRCVRVRFGRVRTRCGGRVSVLLVLVWLNKSRRSRSDMSGLGEDWSDRVSRGAVSQGGHGAGRRRTLSYGGSRRGGPVAVGRVMARSVKLRQGGQLNS